MVSVTERAHHTEEIMGQYDLKSINGYDTDFNYPHWWYWCMLILVVAFTFYFAMQTSEYLSFSCRLVVVGGDGLYQEAVNGIARRMASDAGSDVTNPNYVPPEFPIPIGIIPCGELLLCIDKYMTKIHIYNY